MEVCVGILSVRSVEQSLPTDPPHITSWNYSGLLACADCAMIFVVRNLPNALGVVAMLTNEIVSKRLLWRVSGMKYHE